MNYDEARHWVAERAVIVQGYYIDGDNGQPDPSTAYCRKHAEKMAAKYTRDAKRIALQIKHYFREAWGGSDTVERCAVKSCDVTLDTGGLTPEGVRWALGMDEENPLSFVAMVDELELVRRAVVGSVVESRIETQHLQSLWFSQVLRRQRGVTKKQRLAFEAAWLAGDISFALGLLQTQRMAGKR